jgi:pyruvate formate lyase activating enzyme
MHPAILYEKRDDGSLQCKLCSHFCIIDNNDVGKCRVRKNISGSLFTDSFGHATGFAIDPIEKKPFFHYKPGSQVQSFGTNGCNFKCQNCQNWQLSQITDDKENSQTSTTPDQIAQLAMANNVDGIAYTYSEPTIFFEYASDTILTCRRNEKAKTLSQLFVSNGYLSNETLDLIEKEKLVDAINIDLKFMSDKKYMEICGAKLAPVLNTIKRISEFSYKVHIEIINLVIPRENDSEKDFNLIAEFVADISTDMPLHFSRFYPNYKMSHISPTPIDSLIRAREIAKSVGLRNVYIGNTEIDGAEDTQCPKCSAILIRRRHNKVLYNCFEARDKVNPQCPSCNTTINITL